MKDDDRNAELFHVLFPRLGLNKRGYPHWNNHPAKELLKRDVENKLHEQMTMLELQQTREPYLEFPKQVFAKRVCAEIHKQRSAGFWVYGRNKTAMKNHVNRHDE
jgi:hypothetical protein